MGRVAEFEVFDIGKDWINLLLIFLELEYLSNLSFVNIHHIQLFMVISHIHSLAMRFILPSNLLLICEFKAIPASFVIKAHNLELEAITQKNFFLVRVSSSVNDAEVCLLFPKYFQKHWVVIISFKFSSKLEC